MRTARSGIGELCESAVVVEAWRVGKAGQSEIEAIELVEVSPPSDAGGSGGDGAGGLQFHGLASGVIRLEVIRRAEPKP